MHRCQISALQLSFSNHVVVGNTKLESTLQFHTISKVFNAFFLTKSSPVAIAVTMNISLACILEDLYHEIRATEDCSKYHYD